MANVHAPELTDAEQLSRCCAPWLGLRRHTSRHLWPRAWEQRTNLSDYYAIDVALVEQLGAPLITADALADRASGLR